MSNRLHVTYLSCDFKAGLDVRVRRENPFKCVLVTFCAVTSWTNHLMTETCHMQEHSLNHRFFWFLCLKNSKFFLSLPGKSQANLMVVSKTQRCPAFVEILGWSFPLLCFSFLSFAAFIYSGNELVVGISQSYREWGPCSKRA